MQEIIKEIDELTEKMNEKLCEIRNKLGMMAGADKKYEMTAKDAWDLAANISMTKPATLMEIFDMSDPANIFVYIDPEVAKCLWDTYFHKNKEEDAIKPGDRVDALYIDPIERRSMSFENYIFIGEDNYVYVLVDTNSFYMVRLNKSKFSMKLRKE